MVSGMVPASCQLDVMNHLYLAIHSEMQKL